MRDPHHDHQLFEMKATPTLRTGFCPLCFHAEGSHSHTCASRSMTSTAYDVDGIKHNQFPDGKYLIKTRKGQFIGVYINNDWNGDTPCLLVTYDEDTRSVEPLDVIRIARITEV